MYGFYLLDPPTSSLLYRETSISNPIRHFPLPDLSDSDHHGLLFPLGLPPLTFFETFAADLIHVERAAIDAGLGRDNIRDREYKCTTEIRELKGKEGFDCKYKWTATLIGTSSGRRRSKERGNDAHSCTVRAMAGKGKEKSLAAEIEHLKGGLRNFPQIKTSAKRSSRQYDGKRKELSPQDAASLIQTSFSSHRIQHTQVINGLRDLAVARTKLREIRALFANFSYRRCIANSSEERQRFCEKITVLLLTVEAIKGSDLMIRAARKSMIEELDAMLEVMDPQPHGKLGLMRSRKFDLPNCGSSSKEIELGVAEVVQILDQEDTASNLLPDVS